jgi:probable phosphomutase (TIGR03848 family)
MATLLLIRHGENDLVGKKLAGRLPEVHLNEHGRKQAEGVAQALCKAPIKAIYSSPMERAVETAQPLAEALKLEVQLRRGLIEIDYGRFQGKTFKQLRRTKLWKDVQGNPVVVRFPDGESFIEAQQRVAAELEAIVALHGEEDLVACFTHGDVIRLAVAHYLQMPLNAYQRLAANTTSITVLVRVKDEVFLPHINQVAGFEIKAPEKKEKAEKKALQAETPLAEGQSQK